MPRFGRIAPLGGVLVALSLCLACVDGEQPDLTPSISTRTTTEAIVGGRPEDGHPAVGAMTWLDEPFCTGTLVRPRVVISAAHCFADSDSAEGVAVFFGADATRPSSGVSVPVSSLHIHPNYLRDSDHDIAVAVLARDAPVAPVPFLSRSMGREWIGREALFVGFGVTDAKGGDSGRKRSVSIPIEDISDTSFLYASSRANTCFGDSGGPALFRLNGQWTLIGVTSWGDEDCAEFGVNTRVDPYDNFLDDFIDGPLPEPKDTPDDSGDGFDDDDLDDDDGFDDGPDDDGGFGDDDFGRDCDPELWDEACDEELAELIDDFFGDGSGGSAGCTTTPHAPSHGPLPWVAAGLMMLAVLRRRR